MCTSRGVQEHEEPLHRLLGAARHDQARQHGRPRGPRQPAARQVQGPHLHRRLLQVLSLETGNGYSAAALLQADTVKFSFSESREVQT